MKAGFQAGLGASALLGAAILSGCLQTTTTGTSLRRGETGTSPAQGDLGCETVTPSAAVNGTAQLKKRLCRSHFNEHQGFSETTGSGQKGSTSGTSGGGQQAGTGTGTSGGSAFADGGYVSSTYPKVLGPGFAPRHRLRSRRRGCLLSMPLRRINALTGGPLPTIPGAPRCDLQLGHHRLSELLPGVPFQRRLCSQHERPAVRPASAWVRAARSLTINEGLPHRYDCATLPLLNLFDGPAGSFCDPVSHLCNACNTDADCASVSAAAGLHCFKLDAGDATCGCLSDTDCAGLAATEGPHCYGNDAGGPGSCGCASDADCAGNPAGSACDLISSGAAAHSCGCSIASDCQPEQACLAFFLGLPSTTCGALCADDTDCNAGYHCDPYDRCRARCDGQPCPGAQPVCDSADVAGQNGRAYSGNRERRHLGTAIAFQAATAARRRDSKSTSAAAAGTGMIIPLVMPAWAMRVATCDAGPCPAGLVCDTSNENGQVSFLCRDCVSPIDCPYNVGCSEYTLTCGRCYGPNDCPPDDICSNYWSQSDGVCLASCDLISPRRPAHLRRPSSLTSRSQVLLRLPAGLDCASGPPTPGATFPSASSPAGWHR